MALSEAYNSDCMKILNLYAGIGGNRKLWQNVNVTAVEYDSEIAAIYQDFFPNDTVIVGDAHEYLRLNYRNFDFIWSSPPCPTHSDMRRMGVSAGMYEAMYPDMRLWQEITLLKQFCKAKWVVENVKPYYEPIVRPSVTLNRHCFWANFIIPDFADGSRLNIRHVNRNGDKNVRFGFDLSAYKLKARKDQMLRNCVNPELGLHILESAGHAAQNRLFEPVVDHQNENPSLFQNEPSEVHG